MTLEMDRIYEKKYNLFLNFLKLKHENVIYTCSKIEDLYVFIFNSHSKDITFILDSNKTNQEIKNNFFELVLNSNCLLCSSENVSNKVFCIRCFRKPCSDCFIDKFYFNEATKIIACPDCAFLYYN